MVLSSIVPLVDLTNITITGHNNPTVNCNISGGLHFISCRNCVIEGITWDGCGGSTSDNNNVSPVLQLFNSSNITIQNCLFQHSTGQAIVLSEMIGEVNINHCNFLSNYVYKGHGTAIHYSSNNMLTSSVILMIASCNFFYNEKAKSVLYFGQSSAKLSAYMNLQNSITIEQFRFIFPTNIFTLAEILNLMETLPRMEEEFLSAIIQISMLYFTGVPELTLHITEQVMEELSS